MTTDSLTTLPPPEEKDKPLDGNLTGDNVRASWRFSVDHVNINTAHFAAEDRALFRWALQWCIDPRHPIHWRDFCDRIGKLMGGKRGGSENTLYKLYTGQHKHPQTGVPLGPSPELIGAIRAFKRSEVARWKLGATHFVMTPTAQEIWDYCLLAAESRSPVFVWGPSHIGKTEALRYFAEQNNHGRTIYVRMGAASGKAGMLKEMAQAVGVSPKCPPDVLKVRIINALGPDNILIIDELHELIYTYQSTAFFACLEILREIYDRAQCGFVFCGTALARERIEGSKHEELEQFYRRGVHVLQLPDEPRVADVAAIAKQIFGLDMPTKRQRVSYHLPDERGELVELHDKPLEILAQNAKRSGLKAIVERCRYGRKIASSRNEPLTWAHVCEAHAIIERAAARKTGGWDAN